MGISSQDLKQNEINQVVYSSRGGQFGYFFPPKIVSEIKARLPLSVPASWISESYLIRCFERKGGVGRGAICSYRAEWGKEGIQEVLKRISLLINHQNLFYVKIPCSLFQPSR